MSEKSAWFWLTYGTFLAGGVASVWSRDVGQVLFWLALGIALARILIISVRSTK